MLINAIKPFSLNSKSYNMKAKQILGIFCLLCVLSNAVQSQAIYQDTYQWRIPGGKYIDPVSFFSLHGYVNAVYAGESPDWTKGNFNGIGKPGQIILPNSNVASFTNDEALWISSELGERASVTMELHLVSDPSGNGAAGPGGLTLVLTEANLRYQLYKNFLSISAGTFWSIFGIQNQDWLGAQNLFSTIPLASGAYLTHYNERGVRIDGFIDKGDWGFNYVFSVGNGFNAWDISGYKSFDLNSNKTINSRVSIFPGLNDDLNIGISYGSGLLFETDSNADPESKQSYNNKFKAWGLDAVWQKENFKFRSYLIASKEILSNSQKSIELSNLGWMAEVSYKIEIGEKLGIDAVIPKFRFDYLDKSQFIALNSDVYKTMSLGLNFQIQENYILSFDYNWMKERNYILDNNRLAVRVSANF